MLQKYNLSDKTCIIKYLRKIKRVDPITNKVKWVGPKYGMLIAVKYEDGVYGIGWSMVDTKKYKFNSERAFEVAYGRAMKNPNAEPPLSISEQYNNFIIRASKYFKNESEKDTSILGKLVNNVKGYFA